jgi:hypothetical protein
LSSKAQYGSDISMTSLYQQWRDLGVSDVNAILAVFIALSESGLDGMALNSYSKAAGLYQGLGYFKKYATQSKLLKDHKPMMNAMIDVYNLKNRDLSLWAFYAMHAQGRFSSWSVEELNGLRGFVNADMSTYDVGAGAQFSTQNASMSCNDFGLLVITAMIRGLRATGADYDISIMVPDQVRLFKQKGLYTGYVGPYTSFKGHEHFSGGAGGNAALVKASNKANTLVAKASDGRILRITPASSKPAPATERVNKAAGRVLIISK